METKNNYLWIKATEAAKLRGVSREAIGKAARKGKIESYKDCSKGGRGTQYVKIYDEEVKTYLKEKISSEPKEPEELLQDHNKKSKRDLNKGYSTKEFRIGLLKASVCRIIIEKITEKRMSVESVYNVVKNTISDIAPELLELLNKKELSVRTLKRWVKKHKDSGHDFVALMPNYKKVGDGKKEITDDEYHMLFKLLFDPKNISIGSAVRIIKQKSRSGEIESPSSNYILKRAAEDLKNTLPCEWILAREGENYFKNNKLKPIRRNWSITEVGDVWVSDGKRLDYEIINPETGKAERMTIILIIDAASRYVVGAAIGSSENTKTIALAFWRSVINYGQVPKYFYVDNGKAYSSGYFNSSKLRNPNLKDGLGGLFERLGIVTIFAEKFNPKAKIIERLNLTFLRDYERQRQSFIGSSIRDKPATRKANEKWLKSQFQTRIPTLDEERVSIEKYFYRDYAHTPHIGLNGKKPHDVYVSGKPTESIDIRKLDYLMLDNKERTVSREGIRIFNEYYYSTTLIKYIGKKVIVKYDLWEQRFIKIYTKGNKFICNAYKDNIQAAVLNSEKERKSLNAERSEQKKILDETKKSVEKLLKENAEYYASKDSPVEVSEESSKLFLEKDTPEIQITAKELVFNYIRSNNGAFTIQKIADNTEVHYGTVRKIINDLEGKNIECMDEKRQRQKEYIYRKNGQHLTYSKNSKGNQNIDWEKEKSKGTVGKTNKDIVTLTVMQQESEFTSQDIKDKTRFNLRTINRYLKVLVEKSVIRHINKNTPGPYVYIKEANLSLKSEDTQLTCFNDI